MENAWNTEIFICYISPNRLKNLVIFEAAILHCSETFMLAFIITSQPFFHSYT